jgi:hypothetical protein
VMEEDASKSEQFFGRTIAKITRPSNEIPSGIRKQYYKELLYGAEIFIEGKNFVIASGFSNERDILNLQSFNLAKNPGIYVLFNAYYYYVGQSSREIISRLSSHYKDEGKNAILDEGKVIFFGRTDGKLSKDQLDYIEKELINKFSNHHRKTLNGNSGNTSYVSDSQQIIADYLIQTFHRIASISMSNPYIEDTIITVERTEGLLDRFARSFRSNVSGVNNLINAETLQNMLENLSKLVKRWNFNPILIEHEWPRYSGDATRPIEKPTNKNPFYLRDRDGFWPQLEEIGEFRKKLLSNYMSRRDDELNASSPIQD